METVLEYGRRYVPVEFLGETILTVGRAVAFAKAGASLVVNCAPFGCMPGTISSALYRRVSGDLGVPLVSLFYDGQGTQNQRLEVFLNNAIAKTGPARPRGLKPSRSSAGVTSRLRPVQTGPGDRGGASDAPRRLHEAMASRGSGRALLRRAAEEAGGRSSAAIDSSDVEPRV
jgi:hypothetical protein